MMAAYRRRFAFLAGLLLEAVLLAGRRLFAAPFFAAVRRFLFDAALLAVAALLAAFRFLVRAAFCAAALRLAFEIAIDNSDRYYVLCSTSHHFLVS